MIDWDAVRNNHMLIAKAIETGFAGELLVLRTLM